VLLQKPGVRGRVHKIDIFLQNREKFCLPDANGTVKGVLKLRPCRAIPRKRLSSIAEGETIRQCELLLRAKSVPTWPGLIASISSKQHLPRAMFKSAHYIMALLYKSSSLIPESGIYRVIHAQHRLPHEVTLIGGQTFPPCGKCHEEVRFELVRELPELERERRGHVSLYSLPVVDEEDDAK
jgi:hypothetical protein